MGLLNAFTGHHGDHHYDSNAATEKKKATAIVGADVSDSQLFG